MHIQSVIAYFASVVFLTSGISGARAQIVAVESTYDPGTVYYSIGVDSTYGWRFAVGETPLEVTHLGYFDTALDGLIDSHQVGIWDSAGTLVTQGTVPSGTAGALVGAYRFTLATPATLDANTTYFIGAHSPQPNDLTIASGPPQIYANEISYHTATYSPVSGFSSPNIAYGGSHGVFGGNFQFTPVPEPHHYALLTGVGLAGFFFIRRKISRPA